MKLMEARDLVLDLILAGLPSASGSLIVDPASPDGDPGKFVIAGKGGAPFIILMAGTCRSIGDGLSAATISL